VKPGTKTDIVWNEAFEDIINKTITVSFLFQQVPDESSLRNLELKLEENHVLHKMWIEQPENFPTCIVVKPYPKEEVQKYFKKLKLFKG
jgi:hypothetical protein